MKSPHSNKIKKNTYLRHQPQSLKTKDFSLYSFENFSPSKSKIYESKLKIFIDSIKANKIKYNALKILFEYEDNFKLVFEIYKKFIKTRTEIEILNFYLKSLDNFISLIHSDEPISQLDKTLTIINKYLRVYTYNENNILFRIGDIGTKYYILLNGKAYTLVPTKIIKQMTFDEYRNHLNMLYILGEDYLLEKTMHSNINSCGIAFSDIDNKDNKILRNIYKNYYSCNYEKFMKIVNGEENVMIENYYIDENISEENEEEINNKKRNNFYKILKYFSNNFVSNQNENERKSLNSLSNQLTLIKEINEKEDNLNQSEKDTLFMIKQKLKRKLRRKNIVEEEDFEEKDCEEISDFNIGIPKELLTKDYISINKNKYDGGELPTFFARDISNYQFYESDENSKDENSKDKEFKKYKINLNNNYYYNRVFKQKRYFNIIGYVNIATISRGMSFGEISLLNENHKRTSTIFIAQEAQIGRLNLGEYNNTIKAVRTKIRTDSINFLLSTKLFGDISYLYFLNKYWIYFQCKKIQKGDFLFRIGEECEKIYIIYNGEIKLNTYINKQNIEDLINGIELKKDKKVKYYLNKIKNNSKFNNNSIFEKKQKYCLMIGKKGDIMGLNDIIDYHNNKYIFEGEVITDYLSYYEINKEIIFNKEKMNNSLNIDNICYIINTKRDFMINKLNNIKVAIEHKNKYLNFSGENENNKITNENQFINAENNIKNNKLNLNTKFISLNKNNYLKHFFVKNEKIKEKLLLNSNSLNELKFFEDNKKLITLKSSLSHSKMNSKTIDSSPSSNYLINPKLDNNFILKNINNSFNSKNNNNSFSSKNNIENSSISKDKENNPIDNKENELKLNKKDNQCKPYEFPNIQNINNNINEDWNSFKKNTILKYLILNENSPRYELFKFYKINKNILNNNYFFNTLKSYKIKNNIFFGNENNQNNSFPNKRNYSLLKSVNSENGIKKFKKEKNKLNSLKLYIKNSSTCYFNNEKSHKILEKQYSPNKTSTKKIQTNINIKKANIISETNNSKFQTNHFLKELNFYFNKDNKINKEKKKYNLFSYINKHKVKK